MQSRLWFPKVTNVHSGLEIYFFLWHYISPLFCILGCSKSNLHCKMLTDVLLQIYLRWKCLWLYHFHSQERNQHKFTLTPLPVHWCVSSIIAWLLHIAYVYYRHMERMTSCKWRESLLESLWGNDGGVAEPSPPHVACSVMHNCYNFLEERQLCWTCTVMTRQKLVLWATKSLAVEKCSQKTCPEDARYGAFIIPMQETGSTK